VRDEDDLNVDNPAVARALRYPGGFDDFFRTEYRRIVKALMVMGACLAEAEDCVDHAMEMLLERWRLPASEPGHVHNPGAYAIKTARRQFTKERHRVQTVALNEVEPTLAVDEPALMMESRQFVATILEYLTLAQRQVMYLITEGYTSTEIAEILRKKPNNVRQIAHQARRRLRPLLEPPVTESTHGKDQKS
jgi:RNA polymerase sigma factor (sigma-70 family)